MTPVRTFATRLALGLGLLGCAGLAAGQPAGAAPAGAAPALLARLLAPTPLLADLRELADRIGGRPTGSPALAAAAEWATARFAAAGLENVHAESYTAPRLWLPRAESGEIVAPRDAWQPAERRLLRVAAMPYSTSTAPGGLEAEVVDAEAGDEAAFAALGARARGRWVLVHTAAIKTLDDLLGEYALTPGVTSRARGSGAAGLLWMSSHAGRLLYRHNLTFDSSLFPLPAAVVERDGALRIARLLQGGEVVRLRLVLLADVPERARAENVVAEVRGREKPAEVVLLGVHLDSWDLGRGAQDNGCNVALAIDVARQAMELARAGARPRRTLRFVLYSGEENGFLGSFAEVRSHRGELDLVKAQVVIDIGSGHITGFSLGGRADLRERVDAALAPAAYLGPFVQSTDAIFGTDNADYLLEGVPNLLANQDIGAYAADYHSESDTYDKVEGRELKINAAIVGALVWALADDERPGARRQSRAEVEAVVHATGVDQALKDAGFWEAFQSGSRGRQP
jgi:carboxypeptidase Q